jgi:hypothetical protein
MNFIRLDPGRAITGCHCRESALIEISVRENVAEMVSFENSLEQFGLVRCNLGELNPNVEVMRAFILMTPRKTDWHDDWYYIYIREVAGEVDFQHRFLVDRDQLFTDHKRAA